MYQYFAGIIVLLWVDELKTSDMKRVMGILIVMFALVTAEAQVQGDQQKTASDEQTNDTRSADTQAGQSTADTPGAAESAAEANNDNEGRAGQNSDGATVAPAVSETTSSGSGSPAVLSGDDGKKPDGTNTVQRASINMAGSPANNLGLDQTGPEDVESEMKERQDYTQDKQESARDQGTQTGGNTSSGESEEINNKTRRENNAQSDQNLSAKEKNKSTQKDNGKSEKKSKRKKDKG